MKIFLQLLAVLYAYFFLTFSAPVAIICSIYILLYTPYKWIMLIYFAWIYIDKNTKEEGGRRNKLIFNSIIWKYVKDYFPITLKRTTKLDSSKNYLFCTFPHGTLAIGGVTAFCSNACGVTELFPNHTTHNLTLNINFHIPIRRELSFGHNYCSVSAKSINYILNKKDGGNIGVIFPGGAMESYLSQPGKYVFYYENRKGFIKLALKTGTALVPVLSFGEVELFNQPQYSEFVKKLQDKIKELFGFALLFPYGNWFLPYRKPVVIIVGEPMEVTKIASPTSADIDKVHANFKQRLIELFEEHKYKYVLNPEDTNLIFV